MVILIGQNGYLLPQFLFLSLLSEFPTVQSGIMNLNSSWLYMSEILTPQWMSYGVFVSWVFTIAINVSTPYMIKYIPRVMYLIFAIFMFLV